MKDIQQKLGHSRISTTMDIYFHVTNTLKLDSVNQFKTIISKIKWFATD